MTHFLFTIHLFYKKIKFTIIMIILFTCLEMYVGHTRCMCTCATILHICLHYGLLCEQISVQLQKLPVGCCCGDMVVNHLMYADDIDLLAPSGKGMQTSMDATYAYGNAYDIVCMYVCMYSLFVQNTCTMKKNTPLCKWNEQRKVK